MKRKLTPREIKDIISDVKPPGHIPEDIRKSIINHLHRDLTNQLEKIEVYPKLIPKLKKKITSQYYNTLVNPGENVGILTAQNIGEKQTQSTLNSFHKAGLTAKTVIMGVPRISELLNATKDPKMVSYDIYLNDGNSSISELRETIGHSFVEYHFSDIVKKFNIVEKNKEEIWYKPYLVLHNKKNDFANSLCLECEINLEVIFKYKITLNYIVERLESEYDDIVCICSALSMGRIDIFIDINSIFLDKTDEQFIDPKNKNIVYVEDVVIPALQNIRICGIPNLKEIYFKRDEQDREQWAIETEGGGFKEILSHPLVNSSRVLSNNMWDIYNILGIEAVREFLIDEFMNVISSDGSFINKRHVNLLVDIMVFSGTILSISRYGMKRDQCGPLAKASFEECLDNFLKAGLYGDVENIKGVSGSIMCGKRSITGTGICELVPDIGMFPGL